jgi:hypothetical protein
MTKYRLGLFIVFGLLVAACAPATTGPSGLAGDPSPPPATETPRPAVQALEFGDFNQLLGRDDIAPIYDPKFVSASEAEYRDDELVMGVTIEGEAKAYPVGLLNQREMVNDQLGGKPILVSW